MNWGEGDEDVEGGEEGGGEDGGSVEDVGVAVEVFARRGEEEGGRGGNVRGLVERKEWED